MSNYVCAASLRIKKTTKCTKRSHTYGGLYQAYRQNKFSVFGFRFLGSGFRFSARISNDIVLYRPNFWSLYIYLAAIHRFSYKFLYETMSDDRNLVQKQKIWVTILDDRKARDIA